MALLDRKTILGTVDIKTTDVDVPEWGGAVRARQMTVAERNEFVTRTQAENRAGHVAAWLVATLCVDDAGKALFTADDIPALEQKYFRILDRLASAILEVNELGIKEVDAAAKNSQPVPT